MIKMEILEVIFSIRASRKAQSWYLPTFIHYEYVARGKTVFSIVLILLTGEKQIKKILNNLSIVFFNVENEMN